MLLSFRTAVLALVLMGIVPSIAEAGPLRNRRAACAAATVSACGPAQATACATARGPALSMPPGCTGTVAICLNGVPAYVGTPSDTSVLMWDSTSGVYWSTVGDLAKKVKVELDKKK